ncbi:hypothetical protein H8B02_38205, partial [Bradyrhizobium sp. Pear77]|nr:hypothetical protein [Bradyrhizobium altum]
MATTQFDYSGAIVNYTVQTTGIYDIVAFGAQGGNAVDQAFAGFGGMGAEIGGDIHLTAGDQLAILVGQQPADLGTSANGGGGGTFVALTGGPDDPSGIPILLAAAGGGGGAGSPLGSPSNGIAGQITSAGSPGGTNQNDPILDGAGAGGDAGGGGQAGTLAGNPSGGGG